MSGREKNQRRAVAAVSAFALAIVAAWLLLPHTAAAQTVREPTFEQRLAFGLQARLPSEKKFIAAVVDTVNRGKLPKSLVDRTFFWARERSPKQGGKFSRRPIIYFHPALTIQAQRLRIAIRQDSPPPSTP